MKLSYITKGALTSKPFSFKARTWELKGIQSIDLFDSLGSNIKIDIRNTEIMRILPVNNELINEEWITDKARHAFDGLKRHRFINPMLKKNKILIQTSWEQVLYFLDKNIILGSFSNFIINTGNFADLEHLTVLTAFCNNLKKKINVCVNNHLSSYNLQHNYLINRSIFSVNGPKIIILVGINFKLDNPILNLKLKRLAQQYNILVAYIGSKNENTVDYTHLGNNINVLNEILKGKHSFCPIMMNFLKRNSKGKKIDNNFKNSISIIFGNEIIETNMHIKYINMIESISKKLILKWNLNVLENYSGKINALELGFYNTNLELNSGRNFFYLLNTEVLYGYKENDFVIFQGHHNIRNRHKFNIILPNTTWIEKNSLYQNCFGMIQKTKLAVIPTINVREDYQITLMLWKTLLGTEWITKTTEFKTNIIIDKIHWLMNKNFPNILYLFKKNHDKTFQPFKYIDSIYFINTSNMPFKTLISNYYQINSIEKASKVMSECSNFLNKKKSNFN